MRRTVHVFQNFYENCKDTNLQSNVLFTLPGAFHRKSAARKIFGGGRLSFALTDVFFALNSIP